MDRRILILDFENFPIESCAEGRLEHGCLPLFSTVIVRLWPLGMVAPTVCHSWRREPKERDAPLMFPIPGLCTVDSSLRKDNDVPWFGDWLVNMLSVFQAVNHPLRHPEVGLVASTDYHEPPVALVVCTELQRHSEEGIDQAAVVASVGKVLIELPAGAVDRAPMHAKSFGALLLYDDERVVIEPISDAGERIVVRNQPRVRKHLPKRLAVGQGPSQHPAKVLAPGHPVAGQGGFLARVPKTWVLPLPNVVEVVVDGVVCFLHLFGREYPAEDEEAIEVEEVSLIFADPAARAHGLRGGEDRCCHAIISKNPSD
mmetsp:Transcript_7936/g.19463  ORF Transcript_7936/g.19463 Transcript_7936/m.19463 type:complete len:314 (-) Transcript_7936:87-1028(-)